MKTARAAQINACQTGVFMWFFGFFFIRDAAQQQKAELYPFIFLVC